MIKLTTSNGVDFFLSEEDFDWVSGYVWREFGGYIVRNENGVIVRLHREVAQCKDNKLLVDHRNGNTLDNTRGNLRVCTKSQNMMNRKVNDGVKFKGVRLIKGKGYYQVRIQYNNKPMTIGHFYSDIAGANAYNHYAKIYHGEFARLNVVEHMSKGEWEKYLVNRERKIV